MTIMAIFECKCDEFLLMFSVMCRKPAAVPAAPPPPPPMQGQGPGFYSATPPPPPPAQTQGPGFYSAAQKYADNEEKPTFAQHQSRSFKFLQGMMDSGQGEFIQTERKSKLDKINDGIKHATIYIYKHLCIREFLKFNFLMEMWKYLNYV